ncbi:LacI family DNA-binding transcriptional regulator [Pigmentiphaga soli]|uniref:LacI family DNA-binding transcriptional regulator n=1 Tax=Pigmentiphaga soli TaxID=1007095 RepID=A0ABP8GM90_9BURK
MPKTGSKPPAAPHAAVTMRDVAREAGVSVGTVSRVVNKNPAVKARIREQVQAAIARTGWQPNAVAQSMRTASTKTIGCVLPDIGNPLFAAIAKSAEEELRRHGYAFILANSNGDADHEMELLTLLLQRRVDGLLFAPSDEYDPRMTGIVRGTRVPTVLVERELPEECDHVVSDQRNGVRQAADHLISLGHRRIALVTGEPKIRPGRERYRGFAEAFESAGLPIDPALLRLESLTVAYAYQEVHRLMALKEPPTGIIMGGNMMLTGALRAFALKGVRVPQDVSVVAVGDTDLAELASPPITAVRWNLEAMGREAAVALINRVAAGGAAAPPEPQHVILPTEIVLRRSCAIKS